MMLQFTQAGSAWACEFEVTDKINLHIENAEGILLYQRTAAGKFALIKDAPTSTGPVFDYDLEGLVYPKHIRVICSSLPTYAEVVSDGEITEIKSQTKEVEITANGTTQVAPDAGFSYLTGVSIKTNVPQSGGSGGGGSTMEYLDVSGLDEANVARLIVYGNIVKFLYDGQSAFLTTTHPYVGMLIKDVPPSAISIDFATVVTFTDTMQNMTIKDALLQTGSTPITEAELAAIPRLTKEEFYNLES